jgi:hypothetical protein
MKLKERHLYFATLEDFFYGQKSIAVALLESVST